MIIKYLFIFSSKMELMLDFSKLSLRSNNIYETISELFIIIYSFENPNITFNMILKYPDDSLGPDCPHWDWFWFYKIQLLRLIQS